MVAGASEAYVGLAAPYRHGFHEKSRTEPTIKCEQIFLRAVTVAVMHSRFRLSKCALVLLGVAGCGEDKKSLDADAAVTTDAPVASLSVTGASPSVIDPLGGSSIVVRGSGFTDATSVTIGGVATTGLTVVSDTELHVDSGAVPVGTGVDLIVVRAAEQAELTDALESWSPAEITGARVFDAANGVTTAEDTTTYEWQRVSADIGESWRARDGGSVTWFPQTEKFWMVGGWNPFAQPEGFATAEGIYPNETTTNEVWSSPDGVTWTEELTHLHPQFDPRHTHGTVVWHDKLWVVGGDYHLGRYNHDVLSSADGVNWTVEVADPPWVERALATVGVYDDKLWMIGGQDLLGLPADQVHHNDVWSSVDGVNWVEVAPDEDNEEGSKARFAGRGVVSNIVEFMGRMWLVGGARYNDGEAPLVFREVWSSEDGATWTQHTTPPWLGRMWPDVRVWDGKLWMMFGHADTLGNSNEVWYTADGENWTQMPVDRTVQPGSHAQGVAVTDEFILLAGGNYNWSLGRENLDKSVWRMKRYPGRALSSWTDRGEGAVVAAAADEARPTFVADAFGPGKPGLQFDGSANTLSLPETDVQAEGRSVFWVGRSPYMPAPLDWDAPPVYNPLWTVVGDGDAQACAVGLGEGTLYYATSSKSAWTSYEAGSGLQEGTGEVRFVGLTHDSDGTVQGYIDGATAGDPATHAYSSACGFSRIGSGGYTPTATTAYPGTLGAVVVVPSAIDSATVERMHQWAMGRFGSP